MYRRKGLFCHVMVFVYWMKMFWRAVKLNLTPLILILFSFNYNYLQSTSDSHDDTILAPLCCEISSNASKFAVFSAIRSLVLEHETKYSTIYKLENKIKWLENKSSKRIEDDKNECKSADNQTNIPYVSLGYC